MNSQDCRADFSAKQLPLSWLFPCMILQIPFSENSVNLYGSAFSFITLYSGYHSSEDVEGKVHSRDDECTMNKPACHDCCGEFCCLPGKETLTMNPEEITETHFALTEPRIFLFLQSFFFVSEKCTLLILMQKIRKGKCYHNSGKASFSSVLHSCHLIAVEQIDHAFS